MKRYFGNWSSHESMVEGLSESKYNYDTEKYETATPDGLPGDQDVLFATYDTGNYEGKALVIYKRDGQLREWEAGHCSCNGIATFWERGGTPTTWEALALRVPEMEESYGFLRKADDETRQAFVKLVSDNAPAEAMAKAIELADQRRTERLRIYGADY